MNPNNLSENKYFKRGISLIIVMIITYLLVPILLTTLALYSSFKNKDSFANCLKELATATGPLGDTLGGTMGPIVAIIAALLTYWAFMEQVIANRKQAKQFRKQFKDQKKESFRNHFFEILRLCNDMKSLLTQSGFVKIFINEARLVYIAYVAFDGKDNLDHGKYNEYYKDRDFKKDFLTEELALNLACKLVLVGQEHVNLNTLGITEKEIINYLSNLKTFECQYPETEAFGSLDQVDYYAYKLRAKNPQNKRYEVFYELRVDEENQQLFVGKSKIREFINNLLFLLNYVHNFDLLDSSEKEFYYSLIINQFTQTELELLYVIFVSGYEERFSEQLVLESNFFRHFHYGKIKTFLNPKLYFEWKFGNKLKIEKFLELRKIVD